MMRLIVPTLISRRGPDRARVRGGARWPCRWGRCSRRRGGLRHLLATQAI